MIFATLEHLAYRVETLTRATDQDDMTWWQIENAVWRYVGDPDHQRWVHEAERNVWWWGDYRQDRDWDLSGPRYLTSWDAAYSLVLPRWRLALAGGGYQWTAGLTAIERTVGASAPSAPRAIVAAAIRSRLPSVQPRIPRE